MTDAEAETKQKLSLVLDSLLAGHDSASSTSNSNSDDINQNHSNSLSALLNTVLPAFMNKRVKYDEEKLILKIFTAVDFILAKNPHLIVENNNFETIIAKIQPFYNINYFTEKISDGASLTLMKILINGFGNKLRNNKYIFEIKSILINSLESNLNLLLSTITNASLIKSYQDNDNGNDSLIEDNGSGNSLTTNSTAWKIEKLSTSIKTLQFLLDFNLSDLFMLNFQNSVSIDAFINRIWFCIDNFVINTDLNDGINAKATSNTMDQDTDNELEETNLNSNSDEDLYIIPLNNSIEKFDRLYSILLLSVTNYLYKSDELRMSYLLNLLSKLRNLINWVLLKKFPYLQKIISEVLMKLLIVCYKANSLSLFFAKLDVSSDRLLHLNDIIQENQFYEDLITVLYLLVLVDSKLNDNDNDDNLRSDMNNVFYAIRPFLTKSLESLRMEVVTFLFDSHPLQDFLNINILNRLIKDPADQRRTGNSIKNRKSITTTSSTLNFYLPDLLKSSQEDAKELLTKFLGLISVHEECIGTSKHYETNIDNHVIVSTLGKFACVLSNDYQLETKSCKSCDSFLEITSYINNTIKVDRPYITGTPESSKIWETLKQHYLAKDHQVILKDEFLTISILKAIKRILCSYRLKEDLKSEHLLWTFLTSCYNSVIREIRIMTLKIFPLILYVVTDDIYDVNFELIVQYIGSIRPTKDTAYLFEAIIMTWGELIMVTPLDEKLYALLFPLIMYLGDEDQFRNNMAFHELRMIAFTKSVSPWQLLEPFIPYISVELIARRKSYPTLLFNFCNVINMDMQNFLNRTLEYTIPRFIQYFKEDHVGFIAEKVGKSKLFLIEKYFPKILALLLTSESVIDETRIMKILVIHDPKLKGHDLATVVCQANCLNLACEVLCLYNSSEMKTRIFNSMVYIANSRHDPNLKKTQEEILTLFFDTIMLGLAQWFSSRINVTSGSQPFIDKVHAIKAIICLTEIAKGFEVGIPQIMACLQVALEAPELRFHSLICLRDVVNKLTISSLPIILDFLISFILQKYYSFDVRCKEIANSILHIIFEDKFGLILKSYSSYAYSLPSTTPQFENIKLRFKKNLWNHQLFLLSLQKRCKQDNHWIVLQALDDLILFFSRHEVDFHQINIQDNKFMKIISELFSTVLQASQKFSSTNEEIPLKCSRLLCYFGALDFDKLTFNDKFIKKRTRPILTKNLNDSTELTTFVATFIDCILIKAFISSNHPHRQLFLALAIQEYIRLLHLEGIDILQPEKYPDVPLLSTFLSGISSTTAIVIKPLFNSRYSIHGFSLEEVKYPLFKVNVKHSKWLQNFVENLLKRSGNLKKLNKGAQNFFLICSRIIRNQDLGISEFILPYVCLSSILSTDEDIVSDIKIEMMTILNTDVDQLNNDSARESLKSSYRSLFSIVDYFNEWISERKRRKSSSDNPEDTQERALAEKFLNGLPMELLAKRASQCNSYERAVLLLEKSYLSNKIDKDEFYTTVRHMYSEIDDIDAIQGVLKTFSTDSLGDKLLQFQYSEDWEIAGKSLEALVNFDFSNNNALVYKDKVSQAQNNISSLLNCLEEHCDYETVLSKLKFIENSEYSNVIYQNKDLVVSGLQASIFSGDIEEISHWLQIAEDCPTVFSAGSEESIYYEFVQALYSLNFNDMELCSSHIQRAIDNVGISLAKFRDISRLKTTNIMVILHCLYDFEILSKSTGSSLENTLKFMKSRLKNTSNDFKIRWKIHLMKQSIEILHPLKEINQDLKNTMVESCTILREEGMLDLATKNITGALVTGAQSVDLEYSKLLWAQGDHSQALKIIRNLVLNNKTKKSSAMQITYTEWLEISANGSSEDIIKGYLEAIHLDKEYSKPQYCLGRYYNKLLDTCAVETPGIKKPEKDFYGNLEYGVIKSYLRSIIISDDYLFEALPKVVTIWLDYDSKYRNASDFEGYSYEMITSKRNENYSSILKLIETALDCPKYKWYTVLSQLISRMIHGDSNTENLILRIITELARAYPDVVFYSVYSQVHSISPDRVAKGKLICKTLQSSQSLISKQLQSAFTMLEALKGVCSLNLQKTKRAKYHLWDDLHFSYEKAPCRALVLPLRVNLQINLPSTGGDRPKRDIFPSEKKIKFERFDHRVQILSSMQRPRKLMILGSDGNYYSILCKPNDDLRKDAKLMEFVTVVDRLLKNDRESEKRNLEIESYAVIPLNEEMGIIEMVSNVRTIRDILLTYLSRQRTPIDFNKAKDILNDKLTVEERLAGFQKLVASYPPVLQKWFFDQFPDPSSWYSARNNYIRSAAVMSIVGYLVGMGDRHGDNILLKEDTGSVLHVDFDCLFEKGKRLAVPERVPFRLTQNMVAACGVNGVEGTFRKTAEVTSSLLRNNENVLMNVLETFLYDPIMDWKVKQKKRRGHGDTNESLRPQEAMETIRRKIRGVLDIKDLDTGGKDSGGLAVSVSAQVDAVIQQATSVEALAQMYIGWMPFV